MSNRQHTWALVLAAGEGSRLRTLTTDASGTAIPKQFCSLHGGTSLLLDTLRRAHGFAARNRIGAVVAETHRRWWSSDLWSLDRANITVHRLVRVEKILRGCKQRHMNIVDPSDFLEKKA